VSVVTNLAHLTDLPVLITANFTLAGVTVAFMTSPNVCLRGNVWV